MIVYVLQTGGNVIGVYDSAHEVTSAAREFCEGHLARMGRLFNSDSERSKYLQRFWNEFYAEAYRDDFLPEVSGVFYIKKFVMNVNCF